MRTFGEHFSQGEVQAEKQKILEKILCIFFLVADKYSYYQGLNEVAGFFVILDFEPWESVFLLECLT